MWFAVYRIADGALRSMGTRVASDDALLAIGLAKVSLAFNPQVPEKRWNSATLKFDDVSPPLPPISVANFLNRFTPSERENTFSASRNGMASIRKTLGAFFYYIKASRSVRLDDAYIISIVEGMETADLIAVGRARTILDV